MFGQLFLITVLKPDSMVYASGVRRYLSRPQESAVGMLCKTACLGKEQLLWYSHSGLGKYFKRIAINGVFWIESGIGCGETVN